MSRNIVDLRKIKLDQAKEILNALELPKAQCNDRSAWVLLSLADIKPKDLWIDAKAPLLRTFEIMQLIRDNYGQDYKPNTRETIRRNTLHQFEQAILVTRNRDDLSRATNSKDNNYSLNDIIIAILKKYPDGKWQTKIKEYKESYGTLKAKYIKKIKSNKIPLTLPNGENLSLSPGKHNQLVAAIINEFCSRFVGKSGLLLYLGDTASSRGEGGKLMIFERDYLASLGVSPTSHDKLPDVIVYDQKRKCLFLIEAVTSHGPVSPKRLVELEKAVSSCKIGRIYVTAFADANNFRKNAANIAWDTEVWIADNPDHMIHFNGDRFLGPRDYLSN